MPELAWLISDLAEWLSQTDVSETPILDAQVLAANVLRVEKTWVMTHPQAELDSCQLERWEQKSKRLLTGEPLPYVIGKWDFFGMKFQVTPDVLIPRPETELLVEQALEWLQQRRISLDCRAVDVGTGTGCIAISLVKNFPRVHITASDISLAALRLAKQNAIQHGVIDRTDFVQSDLFAAMKGPFDLICANLPYIPDRDLLDLRVKDWEPHLALSGGADGLDLIRRFLIETCPHLSPGGLVLFEIEASQGDSAQNLARFAFPNAEVRVLQDLSRRDRLVMIRNE